MLWTSEDKDIFDKVKESLVDTMIFDLRLGR